MFAAVVLGFYLNTKEWKIRGMVSRIFVFGCVAFSGALCSPLKKSAKTHPKAQILGTVDHLHKSLVFWVVFLGFFDLNTKEWKIRVGSSGSGDSIWLWRFLVD